MTGITPDSEIHAQVQEIPAKTLDYNAFKEESTSSTKKSAITRQIVAVISFGLIPKASGKIKEFALGMVLPARNFTAEDKERFRGLRSDFIKNNPQTKDLAVKTEDNVDLDGMAIFQDQEAKAQFAKGQCADQKWIVLMNGNFTAYETNLDFAKSYGADVGANVIAFNYRGVSESKGSMSKTQDLVTDGDTFVKMLLSKGVRPENILIHGYSLGGGVATQVAATNAKVKLINANSFSSLTAVPRAAAPKVIGWVVTKYLRREKLELNTLEAWDKIRSSHKAIVIHREDGVISHASSLFRAINKRDKKIKMDIAKRGKFTCKVTLTPEEKQRNVTHVKLTKRFVGMDIKEIKEQWEHWEGEITQELNAIYEGINNNDLLPEDAPSEMKKRATHEIKLKDIDNKKLTEITTNMTEDIAYLKQLRKDPAFSKEKKEQIDQFIEALSDLNTWINGSFLEQIDPHAISLDMYEEWGAIVDIAKNLLNSKSGISAA